MKKLLVLLQVIFGAFYCRAQTWYDVGGGVTWSNDLRRYYGIFAMANDTIHHYLYVGGAFDSAGHMPIENLARWDGKNWSGIGNFYDTVIFALCMYNDTLVIGDYNGNVTFVDSAGNILHQFSSDGFINALAVYKNELYVGSDFDEINNVQTQGIARYNGTNWELVDSGMLNCCGNGENWALYVWNNKLYAGGFFYQAGDSLANNIASWNDTTWAPLGSGTDTRSGFYNNGYIYGIGAYNNYLYVGGKFDSAGGVATNNIARWNGLKWDSVGGGTNNLPSLSGAYGLPFSFQTYNSNLYIGGELDSAGILKWNDTLFSCPDLGVHYGGVFAIDTFQGILYIGGSFDSAGNSLINNIARWTLDTTTTDIKQIGNNNELVSVHPNPTSGETTVTSSKNIQYLKVTDLLGQLVYEAQPQQSKFTFDLKETGMYFVTVTSGNEIETKKVVVVR